MEFVISLVLSHCRKNLKQQMNRCYSCFIRKKKDSTPLRSEGGPTQKTEKRGPWLSFGSSFDTFFLPSLILPYVNWASQQGCLFYLRSSLLFSDLPLFYFHGLFPSLPFSHHYFGLLFFYSNYLTFPLKRWEAQFFQNKGTEVSLATFC